MHVAAISRNLATACCCLNNNHKNYLEYSWTIVYIISSLQKQKVEINPSDLVYRICSDSQLNTWYFGLTHKNQCLIILICVVGYPYSAELLGFYLISSFRLLGDLFSVPILNM